MILTGRIAAVGRVLGFVIRIHTVAREFSRTRRVGEQIQRELAGLIQRELQDPRVGFVTVSGVEVSKDFAYAKVFITSLDQSHDINEILEALRHAGGFLRRELAHRMSLRTIPELRFVYDASVERGNRLSALIDEAREKDKHKPEE